jgi:lycopene cyclase domain-containing protein
LYAIGKQYTGLVFIFLAIAILLDYILKTDLVFQKRFYFYLAVIIGFTLIFNGYLTWRPVVLYGESYQLGFRIFTIPIEDFGYGIALLFMCTSIYEKFKMKKINHREHRLK